MLALKHFEKPRLRLRPQKVEDDKIFGQRQVEAGTDLILVLSIAFIQMNYLGAVSK
jgi:hypothetical protein